MLAPASESLLTRFLYSLAVFASDMAMANIGMAPSVWHTVILIVAFVMARTLLTGIFMDWVPSGEKLRLQYPEARPTFDMLWKDIVVTFADTNWTTALFITVQWVIDLFESWWGVVGDPVVGIVVLEVPILILTGLLYSTYRNPDLSKAAETVADNMLASLNFAIGFFVADIIVRTMGISPVPWNFLFLVAAFVALRATLNSIMVLWTPNLDAATPSARRYARGAEQLKAVVVDNIGTLVSIGVFILTKLFVSIFKDWWFEGEHWIVAFAIFQTVLITVIALTQWITEVAINKDDVPDKMINKALFAMSMFLAEQGRSKNVVAFTEFQLVALAALFVVMHGMQQAAFEQWKPAAGKPGQGERVLKVTIQKNVTTWLTIAVVFLVRLLVNMYADWWRDEPDAIIGAVLIEVTVFLLVSIVKTLIFYESDGLYKRGQRKQT